VTENGRISLMSDSRFEEFNGNHSDEIDIALNRHSDPEALKNLLFLTFCEGYAKGRKDEESAWEDEG